MTIRSFRFPAVLVCCLYFTCTLWGNTTQEANRSAAGLRKVKGTVFNDTNRNRVLEKGEAGIPGVCVTDGYQVAVTDAKGRYEMEVAGGSRFIYISMPGGYAAGDKFYIKKEDMVRGITDFPLVKLEKQPRTFIHVSDTEARIYKDWIDVLKDYIAENEVAFILFSGDICYANGLKMHRDYLNSEMMGTTALFSVGNHDLVDGDYGEQLYEECFGPAYYSFNVGGVHFVSFPVLYGDRAPSYTPDQLYSWLKKDLSVLPEGTPFIFIDHHLIGYNTGFKLTGKKDSIDLNAYNLRGYLYGHYHVNLANKTTSGVQMYSSMSPNKGGIDHSPSSFRVITFDSTGTMHSEIRYTSLDNHLVVNAYPVSSTCMQIRGVVYNSACDVKDVYVYNAADPASKTRLSNSMGDMVWSGSIPFDSGHPESSGEWYVVAAFVNGDVKQERIDLNRSGYGAGDKLPGILQIEWVRNTGAPVHFAAPLIVGDTLYIATSDDNANARCGVYAYNKNTGEFLWFCKTENSIRNTIVYYNGSIYACDAAHNCYRVKGETGEIQWQKKLQQGLHTAFTQGICISNGILYAGHASSLAALDAETGAEIWRNTSWSGGVNTVTTNLVAEGVLLTGGCWKGRFAHDAATGKLLWSKTDNDTKDVPNSPIYHDSVFIYCNPERIVEVDPHTGEEVRGGRLNATINNVAKGVVYKNVLLQGTADKGVVALDRENGYKEKWSFKTRPALLYTAPYTKDSQMTVESTGVVVDGIFYFGANDGCIYGVDAEKGTFVSRIDLGLPVLADLVYNQGFLYVADLMGGVYKLKIVR